MSVEKRKMGLAWQYVPKFQGASAGKHQCTQVLPPSQTVSTEY